MPATRNRVRRVTRLRIAFAGVHTFFGDLTVFVGDVCAVCFGFLRLSACAEI
ncbi:MAG TPA: hypothetical protein VFB10_00920 [Candidatus Dormibacteraeota bacterium]|nr:hypothetical protein [Candidatus Dormibacteraeota bacterium]